VKEKKHFKKENLLRKRKIATLKKQGKPGRRSPTRKRDLWERELVYPVYSSYLNSRRYKAGKQGEIRS